jgi:1-acyl-sn-glycerol-3-phosphate acyltransferase
MRRRAADPVQRAHEHARRRSPGALYAVVRAVAWLILRTWFRVRVSGREHVPGEGAGAIVAANHKSFMDAFFIGLGTRRHVRFMAKAELFHGPFARLLPRLGAFPVRRGEADADAVATALSVLGGGGLVVVFPEGTRVDEPDALGSPHHGAGRLALEAGAPIVPTAISGTSHLWLGPVPKPRRIDVSFLAPVRPVATPGEPGVREILEDLIDRRVWPAVQDEYGRLRATPGVVALALAAVGGGGVAARRLARRRRPAILGRIEPRRIRRRLRREGRLERLKRRLP